MTVQLNCMVDLGPLLVVVFFHSRQKGWWVKGRWAMAEFGEVPAAWSSKILSHMAALTGQT